MSKTQNIQDMDTLAIGWHVVHRHRVFLLIASNLVTLTYIIVSQAPRAVQTLMR